MHTSDRGFPHTVQQWEALLRATHKTGNNKALHVAKAFVTQAQNTHTQQRTEPQHQALKEWMYLMWYEPPMCKGKECVAPKTIGCQASASPGRLLSQLPERAMTSAHELLQHMFPDLPPPHADGWQPHHVDEVRLSMPMLRDIPEMWAEWVDQHLDRRPRGIVVHVMQLIKRRNPRSEVVERQWMQYLFIAAQLFASPRAYWEAIWRLHLTVVPGRSWIPTMGQLKI
jgi:hypothetical protein